MSLAEGLTRSADTEYAHLREIADSLDQIFFLVAADMSRIDYLSPSYERATGYSRESLYENPRGWLDLIYEDDRERVMGSVAKRITGEIRERSELEFRIRTASGEIRWWRTHMYAPADPAGRTERLVGLAEDVTLRKRAAQAHKELQADLARKVEAHSAELSETIVRLEQEIAQRKTIETELRRSEARFRRLFEANIIGVIFGDIYGNITEVNETFLKMTGYCSEDLPLRWDKMTPPEWAHTSEIAIQHLVREGTATPWEKEYFRKDGTRIPVLIGCALLDRETWRTVTFVLDLTRRKNAEGQVREVSLQLEHASRLSVMGEMLADMAHEIHQPLGVITNYANGSLRRLKKGQLTIGALKEKLTEIASESMRVAEVLRRIRDFIRRRAPEKKLVNLNVIVMDALQFTRLELREHRVAVIVRRDDELPPVQADRVQITQVLVNLIINAVHAVSSVDRSFPKLLISTYVNDAGLAEVAVADNGPGIDDAVLPHIFDRFFTTKANGLGLGLAISRSIINSHGGELWFDSTPGESAVFRFTLPPHRAPSDEQPDPPVS